MRAARGNPGPAAFGYVITPQGGEPIEEGGCLGRLTNNQAEYSALVRALEHAARLGTHHRLLVLSDSELMVKQMKGEYKVKNEDLRELYDRARQLARRFAGVTFQHVRREKNKRTDQLCNEALDGVRVYAASGRAIGHVHLPERCANLCFGGRQRNRLFMAASHSLYALYVNTQGAV